MKLGSKSLALIDDATVEVETIAKTLRAWSKEGRAEHKDCFELDHRLRQAASMISKVGGRIFYAEAKRARGK